MNDITETRVRADFNGLFDAFLCLSLRETCVGTSGEDAVVIEGMTVTAFEEDTDENGQADRLLATGVVERPPNWLKALSILPAALLVLLFVLPSAGSAQAAKALDPVSGIIDAFKTHVIVALGEGDHGNEQGAAFRTKLYRDPRFQAAVNDIVVESGNGRYQAMMDRYISGEAVPEKELRMAWLETTQPTEVWDRDIYADMFRTIREINQKLPKEKQLRVLLGTRLIRPIPPTRGPEGAHRHFSCGADRARSDREEAQGTDRVWPDAFSAQDSAADAQPTCPEQLSACLKRQV